MKESKMKEMRRRRIWHTKYYKTTQTAISDDSLPENYYDLSFLGPPTKDQISWLNDNMMNITSWFEISEDPGMDVYMNKYLAPKELKYCQQNIHIDLYMHACGIDGTSYLPSEYSQCGPIVF